jgi:hemolysin III
MTTDKPISTKQFPRPYTKGEEIANAVTHGIGIGLSLSGLILLTILATLTSDPWKITTAIIFGVTLLLEYSASTLYHAISKPSAKRVFKILDHAGIYLLIAGTYTPFTLVSLRQTWGWPIFGIIWGLAIAGITAEAFWTYRPKWISSVVYVVLGCIILVAIVPLKLAIPVSSFWLLVSGGITYALGSIVYVFQKVEYLHAAWHGFVIAGSVCFFLSILFMIIA